MTEDDRKPLKYIFVYPPELIEDWLLEFCFADYNPNYFIPVVREPKEGRTIAVWNDDDGEIYMFEYETRDEAEIALELLSKLAEATDYVFKPSYAWLEEVLNFSVHFKKSYRIKLARK